MSSSWFRVGCSSLARSGRLTTRDRSGPTRLCMSARRLIAHCGHPLARATRLSTFACQSWPHLEQRHQSLRFEPAASSSGSTTLRSDWSSLTRSGSTCVNARQGGTERIDPPDPGASVPNPRLPIRAIAPRRRRSLTPGEHVGTLLRSWNASRYRSIVQPCHRMCVPPTTRSQRPHKWHWTKSASGSYATTPMRPKTGVPSAR